MPAKKTEAVTIKKKTSLSAEQSSKKQSNSKPSRSSNTQKNAEKNALEVTAIDFCEVKLTVRKREFLINYCTPGQPNFHNALQSALSAGYSRQTATAEIYRILREPDIQKIIQKNEQLAHMSLREAAKRAIQLKQTRAFYDPADFFEKKTKTKYTKDGDSYEIEAIELKDLKNMTLEQRMCIDGLDVKGQSAVPVYIMPDRGKELNEIIKLDADLSKSSSEGEVEEDTLEIIMERLTVTKKIRKAKDAISETANLIKPPKGNAITEL